MPKIVFLPHQALCPDGVVVEAETGETILDAALRSGIEIEHACEKSCACTTCHCIVREGFDSLAESTEDEDDMLDKAWGLEPDSRLSCQARVTDEDLVIEIPRWRSASKSTYQAPALCRVAAYSAPGFARPTINFMLTFLSCLGRSLARSVLSARAVDKVLPAKRG